MMRKITEHFPYAADNIPVQSGRNTDDTRRERPGITARIYRRRHQRRQKLAERQKWRLDRRTGTRTAGDYEEVAGFTKPELNYDRKKPAIFRSGLNDVARSKYTTTCRNQHGTALFKCATRTRFRKATAGAGSKKRLPAAGAFSTDSSSIVPCAPGEAHSGYRPPLRAHKRSRHLFSSYPPGVTLLT